MASPTASAERSRGERVDDGDVLAAAHRPPPQQAAEHDRDHRRPDRRARSTAASRAAGARASAATDRVKRRHHRRDRRSPAISTPAPDTPGQRAGGHPVDVVEHLLLVALEGVTFATTAVGEDDDLVLGGLDAQPAPGDEVEQRGDGGVRRHDEAVGQQAGDRRRLGAELGRARRRHEARRSGGDPGVEQQGERGQEQQDRPQQRPAVGSREERQQTDHPSPADRPHTAVIMARRRPPLIDPPRVTMAGRRRPRRGSSPPSSATGATRAGGGRTSTPACVEGALDGLAQRPLQAELGAGGGAHEQPQGDAVGAHRLHAQQLGRGQHVALVAIVVRPTPRRRRCTTSRVRPRSAS